MCTPTSIRSQTRRCNAAPVWLFRRLSLVLGLILVLTTACTRKPGVPPTSPTSLALPAATLPATEALATQTIAAPAAPVVTSTVTTPLDEGIEYHSLPVREYRSQRPFRLGLLAATDDPFFATLARGGQQAAVNLGVDLYAQFPQNWQTTGQKQMMDAFLARGDLDALLVASANPQALLPSLQKAVDAGVLLVMIQTPLPDQAAGLPQYWIETDDHLGGYTACQSLANLLVPDTAPDDKTPIPPSTVYIQAGKSNLFDANTRVEGCQEALQAFNSINVVGQDENGGDRETSQAQISAALEQNPGLSAIFCTDSLCAQVASQVLTSQGLGGSVKIAAMDGDPAAADLLRAGAIDLLTTPKPAEMGYLAVIATVARLDGVTSLPSGLRFETGWETLTAQSLSEPTSTRWLYDAQPQNNPNPPSRTSAGLKLAFVAGVDDPFYYNMQRGAQQAATNLGASLVTQYPANWSASEQTQLISQMDSVDPFQALLLVPTDPQALLPVLQPFVEAGVPILTLDTTLDASSPVVTAFHSNDQDGGAFACRSLAQAIGGQGKFYIQNVTPGIPTTDARERGCQEALRDFPGISLLAVNYNDDDPAKAQAQLATILQNYPDLNAVFSTNVLGAQAIGQYLASQGLRGQVKVAAFDATPTAGNLLRNGQIDMIVAQEPSDMGYLAVLFAAARLDGMTDLPKSIATGYALLTRDNMDDPEYSRYFYTR